MEETGIIRRLDALGRIVIPREFRKLNRIEVGDPLEMRALDSGEIVIRKVNLSAQLKSVGTLALQALAPHIQKTVAVCSLTDWLLSTGGKNALTGELPESVAQAAQEHKPSVLVCNQAGIPDKREHAAVYPVWGDTGVFGALVLFSDSVPDSAENALLETVARLVGAGLQKF